MKRKQAGKRINLQRKCSVMFRCHLLSVQGHGRYCFSSHFHITPCAKLPSLHGGLGQGRCEGTVSGSKCDEKRHDAVESLTVQW